MIQTVNGQIEPEELGVAMCHEHLAMDLSPVRGDMDSSFSDAELIIREVMKMKSLGVRSVIEVTCGDMGRDAKRLKEISDRCGIQIVAAAGCYLEAYHSEFEKSCRAEELCEIFCGELLEGIGDTGIKAGVIGEVAAGRSGMAPSEEKVMIAAAMAGKRVGCAVTTHCQGGSLALEQSALLQSRGMDPDKIVLGHLDLADNRPYYEAVLRTGVNIGFDTIGKTSYLSDEKRADNLAWLVERGYEDHIVLSQDISRKSYLSERGPYSGYMTVMKDFVPMLRERGLPQVVLDKMLMGNPARIFNIKK